MGKKIIYPVLLAFCGVFCSCSTTQHARTGPVTGLNRIWKELDMPSNHHVGLSIFDLNKDKFIFRYKDDQYFTPASNTKLLTMYAALNILGEHLDAAWYELKGDSLFTWGGGDPGTLYPEIDSSSAFVEFIRASDKTILFSSAHFQTERFGTGWPWDDYPFYYQCERNAFPIYGNRLWIRRINDEITLTPAYLRPIVSIRKDISEEAGKSEWGDQYFYHYNSGIPQAHYEVPITFFKNDIQRSWSEATGKNIILSDALLPITADSIPGSSRDTMIKIMMQESDNFIAEQLLLSCSMKELRYMNEEDIIDRIKEGPLQNIPDIPYWVDGSGLSRYNLLTPRDMIWVLQKIDSLKGMEYIRSIFPAGGASGTLKEWFKSKNSVPYIYAKTGTLRNVYCLSGFIFTRKGKVLVFSWMNNQFSGDSAAIKRSMDKIFSFLYDHY